MRLVCKNWNYFILKDKNIWKYLTFHSLIKENIFNSIDSTFTINEIENILQNSLTLPNSLVCYNSIYLRILKNYVLNNDWFNIYNLLINSNLKNIPHNTATSIDNSFRVSVFEAFNHLQSIPIGEDAASITKIDSLPDVLKNRLSDFCKLSNDYVFIGQINCKEISAFLSVRFLPKTGIIYFFVNQIKCTPLVLYEDFINFNEPLFKVCDSNFTIVDTPSLFPLLEGVLFQHEENKNNYPEYTDIRMLVPFQKSASYCGGCSSERLNDDSIKRPSIGSDEIVLLSADICLKPNFGNTKNVTFKIKLNDMKRL